MGLQMQGRPPFRSGSAVWNPKGLWYNSWIIMLADDEKVGSFMLTFEQKLSVIESFPELTRKDVSLGRINFHYEESGYDKKIVVYHLHPNGNGFVYAGHTADYATDERGLVNIRDYSAEELRKLIRASIQSLAPKTSAEQAVSGDAAEEERWHGPNGQTLLLIHEDELWYLYAGLNLESAFETYEEAARYLQEEGFKRP